MLTQAKSVAPEPYFTASLMLLYEVMCYLRVKTARPDLVTSDDINEIHALMNALHNIPASLREYGHWFDEERIRAALRDFDVRSAGKKWTSLESTFDQLKQKAAAAE